MDRDKYLAYQRRYSLEHAAQKKQWWLDNRERLSQLAKERWAEHGKEIADKYRDYQASYRLANRQKRAEYMREYRVAHGGNDKAYLRQYYQDNREKLLRQVRERYLLHKEDYIVSARNRMARLRSAPGSHTKHELLQMYEQQGHLCVACGTEISSVSGPFKYHVDHIVALVAGGSNGIDNLQLLCKRCNLTKNKRNVEEWARERGLRCVIVPGKGIQYAQLCE